MLSNSLSSRSFISLSTTLVIYSFLPEKCIISQISWLKWVSTKCSWKENKTFVWQKTWGQQISTKGIIKLSFRSIILSCRIYIYKLAKHLTKILSTEVPRDFCIKVHSRFFKQITKGKIKWKFFIPIWCLSTTIFLLLEILIPKLQNVWFLWDVPWFLWEIQLELKTLKIQHALIRS